MSSLQCRLPLIRLGPSFASLVSCYQGSTYPFPCRPPADSSIRSVHSLLVSLQSAVKAASSILVVGAGPVGIEFAGEVAAEYPEKKVTIVHSGQALMEDFKPSLGAKLLSQLKGEVKVVLGCRVDTKGLETGSIENQRFDLGNGEEVEGVSCPLFSDAFSH
jgi:NADH dehydrogenase FAD-containing subunit